ncbi:hypothetical protein WCLP8_4410017 [uncultured Gammaproteobacteria bacterium]
MVRVNTEKDFRLLSHSPSATDQVIDHETGTTVGSDEQLMVINAESVDLGRGMGMEALLRQQQTAKEEAMRQMAEIDAQMKTMPGPSVEQWAATQGEH